MSRRRDAPVALDRTPVPVRGEALPDLVNVLDILHPGVVLLHGPPINGKASIILQALLSAASMGLAVGYVSNAHPSFVARHLETMLFQLGLTSKNFYLLPDAPIEAIKAERLRSLIEDCDLKILCIDDFPDHLATKAEAQAAKAISYETGCCMLIVTRPSQTKPPPPIRQLPSPAPRPAALPKERANAKRRRRGKALKKPRGSRGKRAGDSDAEM